jgi:hypothetical protein
MEVGEIMPYRHYLKVLPTTICLSKMEIMFLDLFVDEMVIITADLGHMIAVTTVMEVGVDTAAMAASVQLVLAHKQLFLVEVSELMMTLILPELGLHLVDQEMAVVVLPMADQLALEGTWTIRTGLILPIELN